MNPDTIRAQMQSGIVFGLSAALFGEITIKEGRVEQTNFNNYKLLRMNEMPKIETHIVKSTAKPGGIGEPGQSIGDIAIPSDDANLVWVGTGENNNRQSDETS